MVHHPHAEHVGSLLRPPTLLAARARHEAGEIDDAALHRAEDEAVLAALAEQEALGLPVVTDGEYRRSWYGGALAAVVDGLAPDPEHVARPRWVGEGDDGKEADEAISTQVRVGGQVAVEPLRAREPFARREVDFLLAHTAAPTKVTTIGPLSLAEAWFGPASRGAYPTAQHLIDDVVALQSAEVARIARQGVTHVQLDSVLYVTKLSQPAEVARIADGFGVEPSALLGRVLAADNAVLAAAHEAGATTGVHICRGNNRSAWVPDTGTYEVAVRALSELVVDRLLLEYDSDRAGDFAPLRHVPDGTTVVLGLVTSKFAALETRDDLLRRIEEASRYLPVERLALSPQCGFASTAPGNRVTWDDQRRKLELVVAVADEVWGHGGRDAAAGSAPAGSVAAAPVPAAPVPDQPLV
jgi:5-methyltetrahydropteroyltriglutamate--homocysteine methyltransferase